MDSEFYNYCMTLSPNQLRNVIEAERDCLYRYKGEHQYDFGQMDASVIVFDKCKCALFCPDEAWFHGYTLYASYAEAAGRATLHKMINAVKYA